MNIKPVASKADIQQTTTNDSAKRQAAIKAFNANGQAPAAQPPPRQAQAHPAALDQNAIGSEDLGSLRIPEPNIQEQNPDSMTLSETDVQVVETPTPVVETPQETAASRQFAQLARQTKQLRAQQQRLEQEYKAKEAALIAREEAIKVQVQPDLSKYIPRDRLKSDPLGVLAEAEVTYEQLTQQELDRQNINPSVMNTINELRNEIKALKQVNEDGKKASVDSQQAQYKAAVKQITMDAKALIKSDPVAYEAISKTGTVKEVVKLIEDTYAKDGVLLSVEEAAQEVENYLVDENFKMATRIDKIKKRLGQVAPGSTSTQNRTTETQQPQRPGMKTLTNATSSTRQLSARERAIAAFEGKNR